MHNTLDATLCSCTQHGVFRNRERGLSVLSVSAQQWRTAMPGYERVQPYEILQQAILRGELAPGQPLVETTLAARYNVSRTPIREALTRLEQDRLVERTDRGLVVRRRSPEQILDIYETRIALEATAAEDETRAGRGRTALALIPGAVDRGTVGMLSG